MVKVKFNETIDQWTVSWKAPGGTITVFLDSDPSPLVEELGRDFNFVVEIDEG